MFRYRKLGVLLLWAAILLVLPLSARAEGMLSLASEAAVLMDAETGQVLYKKNMDEVLYPASITKVMTAMLAIEELNPQDLLTVSQAAVNAVPRTSSHISLLPGEQLTVEQALYSIGMESANDAANVLAEAVSGSLEAFGQRMTEKAHSLGANNTNFTNANGLPDSQHYTTAYDMALITAAALKMPEFNKYFSTVNYLLPATNLSGARTFANKDRLLPGGQYYYDGVLMAKTGWTTAAQGTFVAAVQRGDTTLIVAALKSPMLEDKYRDTHTLLNYGFNQYTRISLTGEEIAKKLQLEDYRPLKNQQFSYLLSVGTNPSEIAFSLADLTELPAGEKNLTVNVSAVIADQTLPQVTLQLEPTPPESILRSILTLPEDIEASAEAAIGFGLRITIAAGCVVLMIFAVRKYRREQIRRQRRHQLQNRIQRMKRQMKK